MNSTSQPRESLNNYRTTDHVIKLRWVTNCANRARLPAGGMTVLNLHGFREQSVDILGVCNGTQMNYAYNSFLKAWQSFKTVEGNWKVCVP